jgi:CheY-like chemotaxis protein
MPTVLVVDDSEVDRRLVGGILEMRPEYAIAYATDGVEALACIRQSSPDLIVTDLRMPNMDGLELVRTVRAECPAVPVILVTGHDSESLAVEALRQGAAGYVPKSLIPAMLADTVEDVLALAQKDRDYEKLINCLNRSDFTFFLELENDPSLVESLVRLVKQAVGCIGLCDFTGQVRIGVAVKEALLNAMLRGNLELGPEQIQAGHAKVARVVEERRRQPPYRDRRVFVDVEVSTEEARFAIRDEGPGFDVASAHDSIDGPPVEGRGGRGLSLMRAFMDEVTFNEVGNKVTMVKRREEEAKSQGPAKG